jgi:hypothetical protein
MLRVLTRGGRLAIAVWDSLQNIPAYAAAVELLQRIAGEHAANALRAPFVLGDRNELNKLFSEVAMKSIEITTHSGMALFPSIRVMVEADLKGWLPVMGINFSEEQIDQILDEAEDALGAYATSDGKVRLGLVFQHILSRLRTIEATRVFQ